MGALARAIEIVGGQRILAERIGVTQGRISQWVQGAPIDNRHFPLISEATDGEVTVYDLLDEQISRNSDRATA